MTPLENKARLVLGSWIKKVFQPGPALKLLDALEPVGRGIHPGDLGEVRSLREDAIRDAIEELQTHITAEEKKTVLRSQIKHIPLAISVVNGKPIGHICLGCNEYLTPAQVKTSGEENGYPACNEVD